jgi:hypothetical protein
MPHIWAGNWRAVGASVQGHLHVRAGVPCQDSCEVEELPGGTLLAAVADGAGSAAVSEIGAALAARAAVEYTAALLAASVPVSDGAWHTLLRNVLLKGRQAIVEQAAQLELPPSDLATTLLLVAALPDRLCAVQVGDGAAVARLADGSLHALTRPPVGEYLNETSFLTSQDLLGKAQFTVQHCTASGVALLTDGLQRLALKMPQGEPHAPFFQPLLRGMDAARDADRAFAELRAFLQSPRLQQRADDDLTLLLAVQAPGEFKVQSSKLGLER